MRCQLLKAIENLTAIVLALAVYIHAPYPTDKQKERQCIEPTSALIKEARIYLPRNYSLLYLHSINVDHVLWCLYAVSITENSTQNKKTYLSVRTAFTSTPCFTLQEQHSLLIVSLRLPELERSFSHGQPLLIPLTDQAEVSALAPGCKSFIKVHSKLL